MEKNAKINTIKKLLFYITEYFPLIPFILVLSTVLTMDSELPRGIITGKYFWFYKWIAVTGIVIVVYYFIHRSREVKFNIIDLLIFIFCLWGVVVTYIQHSFLSKQAIILILTFLLYFYSRIFFALNKKGIKILILFFIITGFIEAVWGLGQLYGFLPSYHNLFKTTGSFFNPGPYAGYLAMVLPVALYYLLKGTQKLENQRRIHIIFIQIRWYISLETLLSIITCLPSTMSRAAWLAAFISCGLVLVSYFMPNLPTCRSFFQKHKKKILVFSVILLIIGGFGLSGIYLMKKDSADGRSLIWKISLQTMLAKPNGSGLGYFSGTYGDYQANYFKAGKGSEQDEIVAGEPEYAFNEYFQIGIEFGIIPLLLFLIILILVLYNGFKNRYIPILGSLISILIFAAMSYSFNLVSFVIAFTFLLALSNSEEKNYKLKGYSFNNKAIYAFMICSLFILAFCLYNRYPTYQAYKDHRKAKLLIRNNLHKEAFEVYRNQEKYLYDEITYLYDYSAAFIKAEEFQESNRILLQAAKIRCNIAILVRIGKNYERMGEYNKAYEYYEKAAYMVPHRLYPQYLIAELQVIRGETEKAKTTAQKVLEKKAKIESPASREIKEKMQILLDSLNNQTNIFPIID